MLTTGELCTVFLTARAHGPYALCQCSGKSIPSASLLSGRWADAPHYEQVKSTDLTQTVQTAASHTGGVRHRDKTPYEKRGEGHNSNQTRLAV